MPARRTLPLFALLSMLALLLFLTSEPRAAAAHAGGRSAAQVPETLYFVNPCKHDGNVNVSHWNCGDTLGLRVFRYADIQSVELTIKLKDKSTLKADLGPETDAVFLSNIAVRKFLLPYYVTARDKKQASALRAFLDAVARAKPPKKT